MAGNSNVGDEPLKRQGSLRRVVPSNTIGEPVIECPRLSNGNPNILNQNFSPFFQEYSLIAEYNMLVKHELPGLYVMPAAFSALVWFCVLFVRKGLYQGGIFRFNLFIPEDFPNCGCPKVVFESNVFHPSVDPVSGEAELKSMFPEWRKDVNRLWQVLDHVVQMFCSVRVKNPLHTEAAHLFETSQEEFIQKVSQCVEESQQAVYNPPKFDDPHYINFDRFTNEKYGKVLSALLICKDPVGRDKPKGLSWVQCGSLKPFSASHS